MEPDTILEYPLLRPSTLPRLQECRCFITSGERNAAMIRGVAIDALIRHGLQPAGFTDKDREWIANHMEDQEPAQWGIQTIKEIAKGSPVQTMERLLRPESFFPERIAKGTMDAACYNDKWLLDIKTGEVSDYWPQMACYAASCMKQYKATVWMTYLMFVDKKVLQKRAWGLEEAETFVRDIVNKPITPNVNPHCQWCGHYKVCAARMGYEIKP